MTENRRATQAGVLAHQMNRNRQMEEYRQAARAESMKRSKAKYLEHHHNRKDSLVKTIIGVGVVCLEIAALVASMVFGDDEHIVKIIKIVSGWLN